MDNSLKIGTILTDGVRQYKVVAVLGRGGFGITYKVTSEVMVGNVKVTVPLAMKEHFVSSLCGRNANGIVESSEPVRLQVEGAKKDFISESRRLQSLNGKSPYIVTVNNTFEANNTAYYTMEFVDGPNLNEIIKANGPMNEAAALDVTRRVAEAVATIHDAHITHLDIKPANILLADGKPILIDFGLSKHYDNNGDPTSTLNTTGCSEGFAPIEQYGGLRKFSPTADVYALGATLYTLLTGTRPPEASSVNQDELRSAMTSIGVSEPTQKVVLKAMAYRPADRYADASEMLAALPPAPPYDGELQATEVTVNIPPTGPESGPTPPKTPETPKAPKARSRKWIYLALAAVAVIALVVLTLIPSKSKYDYDDDMDSSPRRGYGRRMVDTDSIKKAIRKTDSIRKAETYYRDYRSDSLYYARNKGEDVTVGEVMAAINNVSNEEEFNAMIAKHKDAVINMPTDVQNSLEAAAKAKYKELQRAAAQDSVAYY